MLFEYYFILVYFFLSVIFSLILFFISFLGMSRSGDLEKYSAYECGFNPFEDTRSQFDVRFYLVGILFIIFDLEITFLFPWCINFNNIGFFGFFSMYIFLFILVIGFYYEWSKGALEW